ERFDDFVELLDLPINLGRPDAYSAGIERRVRSAVDDHAVVLGDLDVIAVTPDIGEALEVRRVILRVSGIVPETERHRRKAGRAHALAALLAARGERLAVPIECFDLHR